MRAGHSSVAFTLDRHGHLYQDTEDDVRQRLDALLARSLLARTSTQYLSYFRPY